MNEDDESSALAQFDRDRSFLKNAKQAQADFARRWLREIDPRVEPALMLRLEPWR